MKAKVNEIKKLEYAVFDRFPGMDRNEFNRKLRALVRKADDAGWERRECLLVGNEKGYQKAFDKFVVDFGFKP